MPLEQWKSDVALFISLGRNECSYCPWVNPSIQDTYPCGCRWQWHCCSSSSTGWHVSHCTGSSRKCATGYGSQVSSKTSALPAFRTSLKDALLSISSVNLRSLQRKSYPQDSSPFPAVAVFSREGSTAVVFELLFFCSLPPDGVLFLEKSIQSQVKPKGSQYY